MFIPKSEVDAHCSPICRLPKFGYIVYEAFKLIYGSMYCDFNRLINAPAWARNFLPLILDPDAPVLTKDWLFNKLSGLATQLLPMLLSVAGLPGIGDGQTLLEEPPGRLVGPQRL